MVQNTDCWEACPFSYDANQDLVLSLDFAVVNKIHQSGGDSAYIDHLINPEIMHGYNHDTYHFFAHWFRDQNGNDLFSYHGIDFGDSLKLEIWNDLTYSVRIFINIFHLKSLQFDKLYFCLTDDCAISALKLLDIPAIEWKCAQQGGISYYFPIFQWMDERIRKVTIKAKLIQLIARFMNAFLSNFDKLTPHSLRKPEIFIQKYFPTIPILNNLKRDGRVHFILESFTSLKSIFKERIIFISRSSSKYQHHSKNIMGDVKAKVHESLIVCNFNISEWIYSIIFKRITPRLYYYLQVIDSIEIFLKPRNIKLVVLISNIGIISSILQKLCEKRKIPSYLIVNGFLSGSFEFDSKNATWINSYSNSIKQNYFKDMNNIICLGDPRMDAYCSEISQTRNDSSYTTIMIGASGFNNVDLNSYIAVEFDFLYDVVSAIKMLHVKGRKCDVIIKTRSNGYIAQYKKFLTDYFPEMEIEIFDTIPIRQLFVRANLFISIYSQTLFEASCLGIPVIYYKKDVEILDPPFDGKSELVTAFTVNDLFAKLESFFKNDPMFDSFKDKKILEKYIGFLDGKNTTRNTDFIYSKVFG